MRLISLISITLGFLLGTAPASASPKRPTPSEYRAWTANGPYYEYICDVSARAGASLRAAPSGPLLKSLPRTTKFLMIRASSYDRARRVWYRIDQFDPRIRGWILADEVSCRTEHLDG
jgi:hypothetical protein